MNTQFLGASLRSPLCRNVLQPFHLTWDQPPFCSTAKHADEGQTQSPLLPPPVDHLVCPLRCRYVHLAWNRVDTPYPTRRECNPKTHPLRDESGVA